MSGLTGDLHWLKFDGKRRVIGCQCGFEADMDSDCGWGDSVVAHLVAAGERRGAIAVKEAGRVLDDMAKVRKYVEDPGNWSALDGRRERLLDMLNDALAPFVGGDGSGEGDSEPSTGSLAALEAERDRMSPVYEPRAFVKPTGYEWHLTFLRRGVTPSTAPTMLRPEWTSDEGDQA